MMLASHCQDYDREVECEAFDEHSMKLCPCGNCQHYRDKQYFNDLYERRYQEEMQQVRKAASKPFYEGWECP